MPKVSILIPAYRETWLDEAISSALRQDFDDFELLIGDDCPTEAVASAVARWDDKRIRYYRNPDRGISGSNRDNLIKGASGEYLKFLFDDDYLYPNSVSLLLKIAEETGCKLTFHSRDLVNDSGEIIDSPRFQLKPTKKDVLNWLGYKFSRAFGTSKMQRWLGEHLDWVVIPPSYFFDQIIGYKTNSIGEPTNVLIHAATLKAMDGPFCINGRRMRFLTDVALYTNFMAQNHGIAGSHVAGSAFRQHGQQASGATYFGHSAGFFEWELLRRWCVSEGKLSPAAYRAGTKKTLKGYRRNLDGFPELNRFIELTEASPRDCAMSPAFLSALAAADEAIDRRRVELADKKPR